MGYLEVMFAELPESARAPAGAFLAAYLESDYHSAYEEPAAGLNFQRLANVGLHALDLWEAAPPEHPLKDDALYQVAIVGHRFEGERWWWLAVELLDFALAYGDDMFGEDMKNEIARAFIASHTIYSQNAGQKPLLAGSSRSAERARAALTASGLSGALSSAEHRLRIEPHLEEERLVRARYWLTDTAAETLAAVARAAHATNYAFGAGKVVVDRDGSVYVEVATPDSNATVGSLSEAAALVRHLARSCADSFVTASTST